MRSILLFFVALALFVVGCALAGEGASETSSAGLDGAALPCDVDRVLARSCRGCHASPPVFGAPMPLVTYGDLQARAPSDSTKSVLQRVLERVRDNARPMPPPPNARLSADDLRVLEDWASAGAPAAAASCDADGGTPPPGLGCTPDLHMAPASAWSMPETTDDIYVCYGFDVPNDVKRHVVAIAPKIDNRNIIHHAVLMQADESISSTPAPCPATSPKWRIVYGWAPGVGDFEFPPEAGYPQEGTTHYVVQIHYNNLLHRPGQEDASGFDFCTTTHLRPNDADVFEFGSVNFTLPPRAATDLTCDVRMPSFIPQVHLFSAFPHMHTLGTSIATRKLGASGAPDVDMGTRTSWDFQNQYYVPIDGTLGPNDVVRTRCVWNNSRDAAVSFGPRTEDEMCFSFTMYWPKITNPQWTWTSTPIRTICHPTQ